MRSLYYPITLPDTFDMSAIERRVRDRAPAFEGLAGLALKAFLVASVAQGATKNLYAPFYFWERSTAMTEFLGDPLFHAVTESFGRPQVFDRPVLQFNIVCRDFSPRVATLEELAVDPKRCWTSPNGTFSASACGAAPTTPRARMPTCSS
jgi:hypothetical protein